MTKIFPQKLQHGDHVRVIAPARSLSIIAAEICARAEEALQTMGLRVSYGIHVRECDEFRS